MRVLLRGVVGIAVSLLAVSVVNDRPARAAEIVPDGSAVRAIQSGEQLHLLSALDAGTPVRPGGWNIQETSCAPADKALGVKLGREALALRGTSKDSGKGDFTLEASIPTEIKAIGSWMHVAESSNVGQVGFQFYDAEGEALLFLTSADWNGWKWIETSLTDPAIKQAYPQKEKNGKVDQPLKGVNLIWWTKQGGPSELVVDALIARVKASEADRLRGPTVALTSSGDAALNQKYGGSLLLTNPSEKPTKVKVELSLQRDGRNYSVPAPDPVLGSDLATQSKSWSVLDGQKVEDNSLTDGLDYTAAEAPYREKFWASADQFVELPAETELTSLGWLSGDANWVWKVDVSGSTDGVNFTPVAELQNVNMHGRWGRQTFPAFKPFKAKVVKFHYHNAGEKSNTIRLPSAMFLWNGIADEKLDVPNIGPEMQRLEFTRDAAPGAFEVIDFEFEPTLPTGQYVLASRTTAGDLVSLATKPVFVEPAWLENVGPASRFGLNASTPSLAKELRKLGIGWVRFENFKWPMVSPAPHQFNFSGGTPPWHLNLDDITREYREAGLNILPMMFMTPEWASQPTDKTPGGMKLSLPPKNEADFGEFAFQSVARYGATKVAKEKLKTKDGVSGLDRIKYFELGNEPDLNPLRDPTHPPTWGAWGGTMKQWWSMWRYGAEAVKAADPQAVLASPGFAGATVETVDALRLEKTPDGKSYLDLVDVLSVHFYSGRTPPEIATGDVNNSQGYDVTFIEHLKRLHEWRMQYKPTAQIWMTETGYDAGGPIGTNEWFQAARLPRVVALCLANGVDKVFVYRESGSDPSQHASAGVVRNDHSRRPSWYTYATLIRQLDGATPGPRLPHENPNVWNQLWKRNGETLLMVNAVTGEAEFDLELGPTTITDAFGGVTQLESTRGLKLTEYPVYLSKFTNEAALTKPIAAASAIEATRFGTRSRDARRQVFAYSFGAGTEPLAIDVGGLRYFQHVKADDLYSEKTKFGFVGKAATKNDFRHWMKTPAEKHSVELNKDHVARFDVPLITYELRMNASPQGSPSTTISVEGIEGGPKTLTFTGQRETATLRVEVVGPLQIKSDGRCLLRWMTLRETVLNE